MTTTQTLLGGGENFFTGLLQGQIPSLKDTEGYYFIDRDGRLFAFLLDFLRTGRWKVRAMLPCDTSVCICECAS